jgi:hypothetical protein
MRIPDVHTTRPRRADPPLRYGFRALATALALLATASCGRPAAETAGPVPSGTPPVQLGGQRVLVLPVQVAGLVGPGGDVLDGELGFALAERDARVTWITPEELRRAVRRSPLFAGDPGALPGHIVVQHGERRVVEPLAGELRRYAALIDARLLLLPRLLPGPALPDGTRSARLSGALIDARSGDVVWWTELPLDSDLSSRAAVAEAVGRFAERLLSVPAPTGTR